MTTATLTATHNSSIAAMLWSIPNAFSLALRYKTLFQMNEAELAARGLTSEDLKQSFIDEAAKM